MAEDDPRVHKATEVHKRRAPKNVRPGAGKSVDAVEAPKSSEALKAAETPKSTEAPATAEAAAAFQPSVAAGTSDSADGEPGKRKASSPVTDGAEQPAANSADGQSEKRATPKRKRWGLRIAIAIACLAIAGVLVFAGFVGGSRWLRYNDEHDIEGTWYVSGTDVPIAFADGKIVFDSNTAYAYTIDTQAKTISYSLGDLQGRGRYWFSENRGTLIITDGSDYTMWSTLLDDLAYDASRFFGNEELPAGEGSIVLTHEITLDGTASGAAASAGVGDASSLDGADGIGADEAGGVGSDSKSASEPEAGSGEDGGTEGKPAKKGDFGDLAISDVLADESEEQAE